MLYFYLFRAAEANPVLTGENIFIGSHPEPAKYPYRLGLENVIGTELTPCIDPADLERVHRPAYLARLLKAEPATRFSQAMGNNPALLNWDHATAVSSALYHAMRHAYDGCQSAIALSGGYHLTPFRATPKACALSMMLRWPY